MKVYFDGRYYDKNISVNDKLYLKNKAPRLFKMVFPSENEKDEREFLQRSEKIQVGSPCHTFQHLDTHVFIVIAGCYSLSRNFQIHRKHCVG